MSRRHARTAAVRSGIATDAAFGAVAPPLHLSSNFRFERLGDKPRYDYSRSGNPTRDEFGAALAELEGASGAVVTPTGMAALTLLFQLLAPGDLLVLPHDCYGGTWRLADALAEKAHFDVLFVDQRDAASLDDAFARRPKLVLAETPSNPLLRLVDLRALAERCRDASALLAVDNTFCSPLGQQPLQLGGDVVLHSTTKYVGGHSDVVGGAVLARDAALHERLAWWANALGITGAPFDSWLLLRGLRTLAVRLQQHERNALAIAELLERSPDVAAVHYPGLPGHPEHALARRQQHGFGGMLSFELQDRAAVERFVGGLAHFTLAESLGGVESLVAHPASMTHASMSAAARARAGITDGLVRLSVGIEHAADLLADVRAALRRVAAAEPSDPPAPTMPSG